MKLLVVKKYYKIVIWTIIIAYLCFSPASSYKSVNINIPHLDKAVHFVMFFIAGYLLGNLREYNLKNKNIWAFIIFYSIYAAFTEYIQYTYISSRSGSIFDFIFDVLGLFVGFYSYKLTPNVIRRVLTKV